MENFAIKGRGDDVQHKNWKGKILRIWIKIIRHGGLGHEVQESWPYLSNATPCNVNCSLWAGSLVRIRGKSSQPITFPRHILLVWWRLRRQKCSSNLHELATLIEITVLISGTLFELSLSLTLCCHSLNLQAHHGGTFIVKPPTKTWANTYEHIRLVE